MIPINPVQKKEGGGFLSKITQGVGGAAGLIGGGVGLVTGGPAGAQAGMQIGNAVGGAASTAGQLLDPVKISQSSPLQNASSNSLDHQVLKLADAKNALNSSALPEPDRLSMNQHLDQALNTLNERRKLTMKPQGVV